MQEIYYGHGQMKINLNTLDPLNFRITKHIIANEECTFVTPLSIMADWTAHNLHLRSSIWNSQGELISASYPKFFNLEEKPNITPFDGNLTNCSIVDKVDGSALIFSRYKGQQILRTRGNIDAYNMPNGDDLIYFEQYILPKIPKDDTLNASYIFEWTSPRNRIVVDYGNQPRFQLTNIISHTDYSLTSQNELDTLAFERKYDRPMRIRFECNSIELLINDIKGWKNSEGICLYYNNDQNIRKIKSTWYLKCHAMKSQCNMKTMLELYDVYERPDKKTFHERFDKEFDFEISTIAKPLINQLYEAETKTKESRNEVIQFTIENSSLNDKDFAMLVNKKYQLENYTKPLAFALRKKKSIDLIVLNMMKHELSTI